MNNFISKYLIWNPILLLRGQNVRPQIEKFNQTQYLDSETLQIIQFESFKKLFSFAYGNIRFYKNKYNDAMVHPDDIKSFDDISNIPILTKNEILQNKNSIYNKFYSGKRFRRSTSGSTGEPLVYYKDSQSMEIMDAILYRNYSWYGIDIGFRQARFWGHALRMSSLIKTKILDRLLNRLRLSSFHLEENKFKKYLENIIKFKAQYIYGYSQTIFQFCHYFYMQDIDLSFLKIQAVILTGEMVFPNQVEIIKKVFNSPVTEEYGCTEVGIIGFRCKNNSMHLMENLMVETIPNVLPGQSEDIVVSELYGNLFPFIRYQMGDRGVISLRECSCGRKLRILENLSGRKDDFIKCPDGKLVDPYIVEYIIDETPKKYGRIYQFKIVQEEINRIEIFFIAEGDLTSIHKYVFDKIFKALSLNMKINVNFVQSLPKDVSGKLRCFVSKIN